MAWSQNADLPKLSAHGLFSICDKEEKGFVTRRDMQRLRGELPLDPDQLEMVFDSLDVDHNGYLTLEEFAQGFGMYLNANEDEKDTADEDGDESGGIEAETEIKSGDCLENQEEDDRQFVELLNQLGGESVFEDEATVKALWDHFRQDDPSAVMQFERFLERVSKNIHDKQSEKCDMEEYIRSQNESREIQVKRLYEEMENQLKDEKERILQQERAKEAQLRQELTSEIEKRDQQLHQLVEQKSQLTRELQMIQSSDLVAKQQLARLREEKNELELQLEVQMRNVDDLKRCMEKLRRESISERRQRAAAALNVTESIALEREGLVKQLDMLRTINARLQDESDLQTYGTGRSVDVTGVLESLADELNRPQPPVEPALSEDSMEWDEPPIESQLQGNAPGAVSLFDELADVFQRAIKEETEDMETEKTIVTTESWILKWDDPEDNRNPQQSESSHSVTLIVKSLDWPSCRVEKVVDIGASDSGVGDEEDVQRVDGCYGDEEADQQVQLRPYVEPAPSVVRPTAVFKIIVLGDSGVGKTSFIRRFCCGEGESQSSTVGIDFHIRCLRIGHDRQLCLQIWDTAGQEKFKSITKQYLRKADGIIVMYDITSEKSFRHVRQWIDSAREGSDDAVLLLVGNKSDLIDQEAGAESPNHSRHVPAAAARRLADVMTDKVEKESKKLPGCRHIPTSTSSSDGDDNRNDRKEWTLRLVLHRYWRTDSISLPSVWVESSHIQGNSPFSASVLVRQRPMSFSLTSFWPHQPMACDFALYLTRFPQKWNIVIG